MSEVVVVKADGDSHTFTGMVKNSGSIDMVNPKLSFTVPTGIKVSSFSVPRGYFDIPSGVWYITKLNSGESLDFSVELEVTDITAVPTNDNKFTVLFTLTNDITEGDTDDNTDSFILQVGESCYDLSFGKGNAHIDLSFE